MQTYTNFELLCIDDCSTDDTLLMLKDFQKIDKRIRIIGNNTKMGAAYTRNMGLEEAKGKYVIFLDGDDIFDKKLLKKSIECSEQYNLDICFFDFTIARKNTEKRDEVIWERKLSNSKYSQRVFDYKDIGENDMLSFATAPWNKLFRRDFLNDNRIQFQSLPSSNDVFFSLISIVLMKRGLAVSTEGTLVTSYDHKCVSA